MKSHVKFYVIVCVFFTLLIVPSEQAFGYFVQPPEQAGQDESKGGFTLIPQKNFVNNRPKGRKTVLSSQTIKHKTSVKPKGGYRRITTPTTKPSKQTEVATVGFTIWKLKTTTNNNGTKGVEESPRNNTQTSDTDYERVSSETPLVIGEVIQISIESISHKGFLYIIHREHYADGTYNLPKVIYPIRGRNNYVTPGMQISTGVINIVAPQLKKRQVAEVFTVIISPNFLISPEQLEEGFLDLEPVKFNDWEKKWKVGVTVLEQEDGAGKLMTADEGKGIRENRILTQDDPSPQTIYQANIKRGDPIFADVKVKFKSVP